MTRFQLKGSDRLRIPLMTAAVETYWNMHPDWTLMELLHAVAEEDTSDELLYHRLVEEVIEETK